jgi:hypothetical protein
MQLNCFFTFGLSSFAAAAAAAAASATSAAAATASAAAASAAATTASASASASAAALAGICDAPDPELANPSTPMLAAVGWCCSNCDAGKEVLFVNKSSIWPPNAWAASSLFAVWLLGRLFDWLVVFWFACLRLLFSLCR